MRDSRPLPAPGRPGSRGWPRPETVPAWLGLLLLAAALGFSPTHAASAPSRANRLTYLDESDPFHVGRHFPRLITPQWIGEEDVDVAVVLAIDDLRDPRPYETFLRPILERLKQVEGRAALSIFCNAVDPADPLLAGFVREGVSLEVHTLSHPCPILEKGSFPAARDTFHGGVDLLSRIPGNVPVAFRTPCCDSINSPSPRVFAELFMGTTGQGRFLQVDSSVLMLMTPKDPALPRELVLDADGRGRFTKYVPFPSFVTTVQDYPYPWVIGGRCWEFPCIAPSDWQGQNLLGKNHPTMLADWKAALDAIALKQGTFSSVFHPHGWSTSAQWVEFIDHAVATLGRRVRFLNLRDASERLTRHLTAGVPLRAADGGDHGVRLLDLDADGFLDVVIGNERLQRTRLWLPAQRTWRELPFPAALVARGPDGVRHATGLRFGIIHADGAVSCLLRNETTEGAWTFREGAWQEDRALLSGLHLDGHPVLTVRQGVDQGARFRDMDGDGAAEFLLGHPSHPAIFEWQPGPARWTLSQATFPPGTSLVDAEGRDAGARFADLNDDGLEDFLFSNPERYGVWLFQKEWTLGWARGWTRKAMAGERSEAARQPGEQASWVRTPPEELPPFVRPGPHPDNGAWIHSRHVWIQNENTAHLPDLVDRRSFDDLLRGVLPPALSPEESRRRIQVAGDFVVELVAAEPLVRDPVAVDWDENGGLWVAEMGDYPLGLDGAGTPGGVIRRLTDTDGDGVYDQSTVFMDHVPFPNGVMPWRGGVLVSAAPSVFFAEDTDRDGRADRREDLITGFVEGNQQHRVNGFAWGLDGWVYGANGDSGGEIRSERTGQRASLRGRDFRFRPDTGEFEVIEGQTQYGRFRDDWGHWFGNANYTWLWHYPWPAATLARNPVQGVRDVRLLLADGPGRNRVHPISRALPRPNQVGDENTVTSACGGSAYRDDLLGPDFLDSIFIAEPTENLVHREVLNRSAPTLSAARAPGEEAREFLASSDPWFRPVQTRTGPDGALYVVDMYRLVIEHPEWIPPDLKARLDLRAGHDRGRIYRIRPRHVAVRTVPRLSRSEPAALVAALRHPNGWVRDTAMRLLLESPESAPHEALKAALRGHASPQGRAQILATLSALGLARPEDLALGLDDPHPGVQTVAAQAAEATLLRDALKPEAARALQAHLARRSDTVSASAAPALASALGASRDSNPGEALLTLARRFAGDPVLETTVQASAARHARTLIPALEADSGLSPKLISGLLADSAADPALQALTMGLLQRWHERDQTAAATRGLAAYLDGRRRQGPVDAALLTAARPLIERSLTLATDSAAPESERLQALRVLEHGARILDGAFPRIADLVVPPQSPALQKAALRALGNEGLEAAGQTLLAHWRELGPDLRNLAVEAFLAGRQASLQLVAALESGTLPLGQLPAGSRQRLITHRDDEIRQRATQAFGRATAARAEVLRQYAAALDGPTDATRGKAHFLEHCAPCHRFQGAGVEIGPDLGLAADKTPSALLIAVLDPNQAYEERYTAHVAVLKDGREFSGIVSSESPHSLTLRNVAGVEETLLRQELRELRSLGRSLMPEGFELSLDPAAMRDLLAYLAGAPRPRP